MAQNAQTAQPRRRKFLRPSVVLPVLAIGAIVVAFGLFWFQPWKLVVDKTGNEAIPTASGPPPSGTTVAPNTEPIVLAQGDFITHEHGTSGSVQLLQLADGQRVLRLEDLDTSNGPLLKVYLTDQPVIEGSDGWHVFDDGRYEDLGDLKFNKGSSNYVIPSDIDIAGLNSVSIWCDRFDVSFGAATLTPV